MHVFDGSPLSLEHSCHDSALPGRDDFSVGVSTETTAFTLQSLVLHRLRDSAGNEHSWSVRRHTPRNRLGRDNPKRVAQLVSVLDGGAARRVVEHAPGVDSRRYRMQCIPEHVEVAGLVLRPVLPRRAV